MTNRPSQEDEYDELILSLEVLLMRHRVGDLDLSTDELARRVAAYCGIYSGNDLPTTNRNASKDAANAPQGLKDGDE